MSTIAAGAVERNITLAFDFAQAIVDDPDLLDEIPDNVTLVLLPEDDPGLAEANIDLGVDAARAGANVYFRHVKSAQFTP